MPNGTTDHFGLKRVQLGKLLDDLDAETIVAAACETASFEPITVAALKQVLHECPDDDLMVFEQDEIYYLIPLGKWAIAIDAGSPIREGLDRCNAEWHEEVRRRLLGD